MRNGKKALLLAFGVSAAVAAVGLLVLVGSAGSVVRAGIESVGTRATRAPVTVGAVDLAATSGSGEIRDLRVGNPEGFATESALRCGSIRVVVDTATLRSDPVVIREIVIDAPQITYEVGTGRTNLGTIERNVAEFARGLGSGGGAPPDADAGPRLVIESLHVRGGRIAVSATLLDGREVGADLGDIHLTDIGRASGGATAAEVTEQVVRAIGQGTVRAVGRLGIPGLSVEDLGRGLLDQGRKAVEGVGDALGGLLGR